MAGTYKPHGKHLISGKWVESANRFSSTPTKGEPVEYCAGTPELVDLAATAAEEAFMSYGYSTRAERAGFLNAIADEIEARGDDITAIGTVETGLPEARLEGERGRTTGQLRLFADCITKGDYLDRRHDEAMPDRAPLPRPDLKMVQRPIGPVAVFGASNFPLAFSTAGGDTAASRAAGSPVVVKGHSAHPGTSEIVADAVKAAIEASGMHPGTVSLIQGGDRATGTALVQHPLIKAVGFTGSLGGGRALFDLCAGREEPIPFFGELGSVNPMFVLPEAMKARGDGIAEGWVASLTMGVGQFCTNPGIVVALDGGDTDAFTEAARNGLDAVTAQTMLTAGIADAYRAGQSRMAGSKGVDELLGTSCEGRNAMPYLYSTTGDQWLKNGELGEEVFGPLGLVVKAKDKAQMHTIAESLDGQLTCTIHLDGGDSETAAGLMPILERKAGRILANGFPTGVEVCDAMVHGGPYPASTNFGATSVGTLAIRRFLRPVCYQNMPSELLPLDLRG